MLSPDEWDGPGKSQIAVDIPPMFDAQDNDNDLAVVNGIQDDVVLARVDAANMGIPNELARSGMPGILGQQVHPALDALLNVRGQGTHGATGGIGKDHLKGHLQPQFALELFPRDALAAVFPKHPQFSIRQSAKFRIFLDELMQFGVFLP
jgi:hypothetical protein